MKNAKVLFVQQEISPYVKDAEMSMSERNLPQGILEKNNEIRIFMPRFGCINERRNQLHEVIRLSGMNLIINDADHPLIIKVASLPKARMQIYFIDNDDFFTNRKATVFDSNGKIFEDNDDRMVFFGRGVLEAIKKQNWAPNIVNCSGWMTALVPLFVKKAYSDNPLFSETKVIYTICNDDFEGCFRDGFNKRAEMPGITPKDTKNIKKEVDYITLQKFAIDNSDAIIFGSEKINPELEKYAKSTKKPILPYQTRENIIDAYSDFCDQYILNK